MNNEASDCTLKYTLPEEKQCTRTYIVNSKLILSYSLVNSMLGRRLSY